MKNKDKELILDKNYLIYLFTNILNFVTSNIKIQTDYNSTINDLLEKLSNSQDEAINTLINDLKLANKVVTDDILKLEDFSLSISTSIQNNTLTDEAENILTQYVKYQKHLLKQSIKINEYIKEAFDYINSSNDNGTQNNIVSNDSSKKRKHIIIKENTLIISEKDDIVVLPYSIKDLDKIIKDSDGKYSTHEEVVEEYYTIPYSTYKKASNVRFKEAYKLAKLKSNMSFKDSISLGLEVFLNYNLHPAIISACKNIDEFDIYLSYLETDEVDKYNCFNIIYENKK